MYKISKELKEALVKRIEGLKEKEKLANNEELKSYFFGKWEALEEVIKFAEVI